MTAWFSRSGWTLLKSLLRVFRGADSGDTCSGAQSLRVLVRPTLKFGYRANNAWLQGKDGVTRGDLKGKNGGRAGFEGKLLNKGKALKG